MFEYIRNEIYDLITVQSIITIYDVDLRTTPSSGESHDFPEIIYVRQGFSDIPVGNTLFHLEEGQLLILPPNAYHGTPDIPTLGTAIHSIFSFECSSPLLKTLFSRILTLTEEQRRQFIHIIQEGLLLFQKAPWQETGGGMVQRRDASDYAVLALKKQLELFLLDLYYTNVATHTPYLARQKAQQMAQLTQYLLEHLNTKMTLEEMGRAIGMSVSTLRRMVQEQQGCGPIAYFLRLRIDEAKRLIREGNLTFTEIAGRLGFETVHYFSRQFKNHVGVSPREYAKRQE